MIKIKYILLSIILILLISNCNTPTDITNPNGVSIEFQIPKGTYFKITVNNLIGDEIVIVAEGELRAGSYHFIWDGKNKNGNYVDEGLYHICIYNANGSLLWHRYEYFKKN
jgi:flagellar hook assembly protein FlgD